MNARPAFLTRHTSPPRASALAAVAAVLLLAYGCGSRYELESGTTEIAVDPGTWQFEQQDVKAGGDSGAAPIADVAGRRAGDVGAVDRGNDSSPSAGVDAEQNEADVPTDAASCAPCDTGCVDDPCTTRSCEQGCCVATAKDPASCDDGLVCTVDSCDPELGCQHATSPGNCLVDGACYADGEGPANAVCAVCASDADPAAFSLKPGCCTQDADCPAAGVCDTPACNVADGTCSSSKKLGCCESDAACDDGDLCTLDSCDLSTGVCQSVPKVCADLSACEPGVCDATTGACTTAVKPGFCAIAGSCVLDGGTNPAEPCLRCHPLASQTAWTPDIGASCDDNEVCTQNDVCTEKGSCLGQPKANCCKSDADCAPLTDACTTALCLLSGNVCVVNDKPGCCKEGACCDLASNALKPAGSMCAATIAAFEYQCVGQQAQRRDLYPGCTGQSATVCSSDAQHLFAGNWTTTQTCPSDTTCTLTGSGQPPTCAPKGSCVGACGGTASTGACSCTPGCEQAGTCCSDYKTACACTTGACCASGTFAAKGTPCGGAQTQYQCSGQAVQKRDGVAACNGGSASCPAVVWGAWKTEQTCPSGTVCTVDAGKTSGSCQQGSSGTCSGKCGGQGVGGCWCDTACTGLGDCCGDFGKFCPSLACGVGSASCKGKCDGQGTGGCWCDSACTTLGDCCPDKAPCCGG